MPLTIQEFDRIEAGDQLRFTFEGSRSARVEFESWIFTGNLAKFRILELIDPAQESSLKVGQSLGATRSELSMLQPR